MNAWVGVALGPSASLHQGANQGSGTLPPEHRRFMTQVFNIAILFAIIALAGCRDQQTPGSAEPASTCEMGLADVCKPDQRCQAGVCVACTGQGCRNCGAHADCPQGQRCQGLGTKSYSARCADCSAGECDCRSDDDCEHGYYCSTYVAACRKRQ